MSPSHTDILIIGAGMAGLTLACGLAKQGFAVTLLEKKNIAAFNENTPSDGRASAIAYSSQQALQALDLWDNLSPHASPIHDIEITDGDSPFFLHFDHKQVGTVMGYMVENHAILTALLKEARSLPNLTLLSPHYVTQLEQLPHAARATLDDGQAIEARLLVATDGKYSAIREMVGIHTASWDYGQTAIVCSITHSNDHQCVAYERFLPGGPFAILPLKGGMHSSLVWVEKTALVPELLQLPEEELTWHIQKRVGDMLGEVTLSSRCFSYPLSASFAKIYHKGRVVLVGDAAHSIHPIAGQGFNLGLQDIASLVESILYYNRLGLDIGTQAVLNRYSRERKPENMAMLAITDNLTRLFSSRFFPIKHSRRLGIGLINHLPPLQRFFIGYAMGMRKTEAK